MNASADRDPVVVTGLGAVSPIGVGLDAYARGLREGRSGTRLLDAPDWTRIRSTAGARCPGFDPLDVVSPADVKRLPRCIPMAMAAAREAAAHAKLDAPDDSDAQRTGLILGTGGGGIDFTLSQADAFHHPEERSPSLWTITNATHGNLAGELSIDLGLRGPSLCVSTGCASSSDAIGMATDLLRSERPGSPRAMIVVGADAHIREETLMGMELLRVISTRHCETPEDAARASRPFDAARDGFILGEGAWALALERGSHARERSATVLASIRGYGSTCDAFHRVRPRPDMTDSVRAMRDALADARLAPEEIDVVHYHGTGTELNDRLETQAVREAFGAHADGLEGCAIKSMIGHPQGACGAAAVVAAIASMRGGFTPPTINLTDPDPACDLRYTPNESRPSDARTALVNCLAFGAKNSVLVVGV